MVQHAEQYLNRPYDIYFSWDNQAIYCSELVWKAYDGALRIQLAPLEKLRQFNLNDPVVQKLMRQRYGTQIPFNENVISPKALYESKLLREVMRK